MSIRHTGYMRLGQPVMLAFVSVDDEHPELTTATPPSTEPPPKLKFERAPRWSERSVRCLMGRDREQGARVLRRVSFEATMRQITRGHV